MSYPQNISENAGALIAAVEPGSPAARAGLEPGMRVLSVDGEFLRDILDWHWLTDGSEIELEVGIEKGAGGLADKRGRTFCLVGWSPANKTEGTSPFVSKSACDLTRQAGESWGITFSEVLFDGLRRCENTCSFCFMKMLPDGMRPALYVRDDDYRLSFLHGNFVTLSNLSNDEVARIIEMHLSPLNVSLHAIDPAVRAQMMGKNHARGIQALEQLLAAGIEFKAQIVLMPGINDGTVLEETLSWIAERTAIIATGIVPYGYTRHAQIQQGYDTAESARRVIQQVEHRSPQVQLADEFYLKAWPGEVLGHLPPQEYYDDYPMLPDGIGMLRHWIETAAPLSWQGRQLLVTGEAFAAVLQEVMPEHRDSIVPIKNNYFGGNVDVAGLLTAEDIVQQALAHQAKKIIVPSVIFNDDGLTLDNKTVSDIAAALAAEVQVV